MPTLAGKLIRVTDDPTLPEDVSPDDLSELVKQIDPLGFLDRDYVWGETTVRRSYGGLPQISEEDLVQRSWADRARDLVRDGWIAVRGFFKPEEKPEPLPELEPEEFPQIEDCDWEELARLNAAASLEREEIFKPDPKPAIPPPKPPKLPEPPKPDWDRSHRR